MANSFADVSKYLSINILALRKSRNLTQAGLAKVASVPRSTITYLESGAGNPSLSHLVRIAAALQVSIEELLLKPRAEVQIFRKEEIPKQSRGSGNILIEKILPDPIPGTELDRVEIRSKARMGGTPHLPNTKEYTLCIEGEVEVSVSGQKYNLRQGDVLAFPGNQPHSYFNPTDQKSVHLSVVVMSPVGI